MVRLASAAKANVVCILVNEIHISHAVEKRDM
jgi:hypothetical protein